MEWVSVKDRLPENGEWVLILYRNLFIDCGLIDKEDLYHTTHWMLLPPPPPEHSEDCLNDKYGCSCGEDNNG